MQDEDELKAFASFWMLAYFGADYDQATFFIVRNTACGKDNAPRLGAETHCVAQPAGSRRPPACSESFAHPAQAWDEGCMVDYVGRQRVKEFTGADPQRKQKQDNLRLQLKSILANSRSALFQGGIMNSFRYHAGALALQVPRARFDLSHSICTAPSWYAPLTVPAILLSGMQGSARSPRGSRRWLGRRTRSPRTRSSKSTPKR